VTGDELVLAFSPELSNPSDQEYGLYCYFINRGTGEIREQTTHWPNTRGWRETVANRMKVREPGWQVPKLLLPRRSSKAGC
jgi:hypothetical protein